MTFGDRPVQHLLYLGLVKLRAPRALARVVQNGERVRAYHCPYRAQVLALVHLAPPDAPPRAPRTEAFDELAEPVLEDFRRRFR